MTQPSYHVYSGGNRNPVTRTCAYDAMRRPDSLTESGSDDLNCPMLHRRQPQTPVSGPSIGANVPISVSGGGNSCFVN